MYEGNEQAWYGLYGNIHSVAFNPIRDTLFCGNEDAYTILGMASGIATSMMMPVVNNYPQVGHLSNEVSSVGASSAVTNVVDDVVDGMADSVDDALKGANGVDALDDATVVPSISGEHSLSNVEARKWYLEQERKIPDMIDTNLPLEEQAKQAFNLRNQFRTQTRELMADRKLAESLYKTDPNRTWEEMIHRQMDKGFTGDDIYKEIIASSQRSSKSVNKLLELE